MDAAAAPQPGPESASLASARDWFRANGLTRPGEKRLLGGVSAGLARRYGVDRFAPLGRSTDRSSCMCNYLLCSPQHLLPGGPQ